MNAPWEPKAPFEVLDQARFLALVRLVAIAEQIEEDPIHHMNCIRGNFAVTED